VLAAWTGFRPLVKPQKTVGTAGITRDHHIEVADSGLVTVTGGKWTTYRHMAADAVDTAIRSAGLQPDGPSRTEQLPLTGAAGFTPGLADSLQKEFGLEPDVALH